MCAPGSLRVSSFVPTFVSTTLVPGERKHAYITDRADPVREVEDATTLVSTREDVEGLVRKVSLLKGELTEARWAREVTEEKFYSLSDASADGAQWLVVSEMDR
jgi:hypothetical protein